jgi:hypothetical protein
MDHRSLPIVFALATLVASSARAQQTTAASPAEESAQELAKTVHNPFEDFIEIPIQSETRISDRPEAQRGREHQRSAAVAVSGKAAPPPSNLIG